MKRVLVTKDGLRISRAVVDVTNPPSLTEEHLFVDPSWQRVERLHHLARFSSTTFLPHVTSPSFKWRTVSWPALAVPPLVSFIVVEPGTNRVVDMPASVFLDSRSFPHQSVFDRFHVAQTPTSGPQPMSPLREDGCDLWERPELTEVYFGGGGNTHVDPYYHTKILDVILLVFKP